MGSEDHTVRLAKGQSVDHASYMYGLIEKQYIAFLKLGTLETSIAFIRRKMSLVPCANDS